MKDLTITAIIKVYQYDELNEADRALVKTAMEATARSYVSLLAFLGRCRCTAGQRDSSDRNQSGKCGLSVGTLCRTYHPILCQLPISRPTGCHSCHCGTERRKDFIDHPIPPCGACRQVILETEKRYKQPIRILLIWQRMYLRSKKYRRFTAVII